MTPHTASVGVLLQSSPLNPSATQRHEVPLQACVCFPFQACSLLHPLDAVSQSDKKSSRSMLQHDLLSAEHVRGAKIKSKSEWFLPRRSQSSQVPHGRKLWQDQQASRRGLPPFACQARLPSGQWASCAALHPVDVLALPLFISACFAATPRPGTTCSRLWWRPA